VQSRMGLQQERQKEFNDCKRHDKLFNEEIEYLPKGGIFSSDDEVLCHNNL